MSRAILVAALVAGASAIWDTCPRGPVGSCLTSACSPSRGPTECDVGQCNCIPGYCRYPNFRIHVQARRCRAQVPDSSCHLTRVCWHGGLLSSSCVSGRCLCRSHMHVGSDGKCYSGWYPSCSKDTGGSCSFLGCSASRGPTDCVSGKCLCKGDTCAIGGSCVESSTLSLAANSTTPAEYFEEDPEIKREEDLEIFANVALAGAFVALPFSLAAGALMLYRARRRRNEMSGDEYHAKLLDGAEEEVSKAHE